MTTHWTEGRREDAARRARLNKPWLYSTGPRTPLGKKKSSRNSLKHGYYNQEKVILRWYLRLCALRLKQAKGYFVIQKNKHRIFKKTRNELIQKNYKPTLSPLKFTDKIFKYGHLFGLNPDSGVDLNLKTSHS
jgi:hypothetical protein